MTSLDNAFGSLSATRRSTQITVTVQRNRVDFALSYRPRMFRLPFIPHPNPDEILGSWLARIALLNGRGAWRALLETTGHGRRIENPVFDMTAYSVKFEALLSALGFSYEQAMIELTTLPYWLTFDAIDLGDSPLPGTTGTPNLSSDTGQLWSSMKTMGINRSGGDALKPRYCPKCLEEDVVNCGAAYWHRAHQIPNVIVCHRHGGLLRTACPSCGIAIAPAAKRLIGLPALRCSCGQNLCASFATEIPRAPYLALARLSSEALAIGQTRWNRDQVRSHLSSVLKRGTDQTARQYQIAIETAFGKWHRAERMKGEKAPGPDMQHPDLKLRMNFSTSRAPECCALMAALNLDFASAIPEFIKASSEWRLDNRYRVSSNSWDAQRSKDEILRRSAKYPGRPPSTHRSPYWFLRLNDPDWLYQTFPTALSDPIPSIEQDRRDIQSRIENATTDFLKLRLVINESTAGLRAFFRDRQWLQDRLSLLQSKRKCTADALSTRAKQGRVNALWIALAHMLKSEQRPIRIYATSLGAAVGLSHSQAGSVIRASPELKSAIVAANTDKHRRQVLWAAQQLQKQGGPLSLKAILKQASLPTRAVNFEFARAAVARIQSEKAA